ncbi:MAG: 4-hydroxy-3-methylbut-2-enyl diphosphate reductase [Atopobiaceae bacterium]|nr:4-hydroxy-3-methylbut-2-enyl diphosphate reductase [Atopobiaceae bacterium]
MSVTIEVAREAGACYGVERALNMARKAADGSRGGVYTLGPLIHNPVVVAELERDGVQVADEPEVGAGATLLLRTHGVTPLVEEAARESGATVLDATCPFVKKVHKAVERLAEQGYQVVIVGEKGHPEVEGTLGHAPDALVVGSPAELEGATLGKRVGVVVQTTMALEVLTSVVDALLGLCEEVRVLNTICDATSKRQDAARELAQRSDVMVVIGGRNSANTTHLAQICAAACSRTHHIETADELEAAWFAEALLVGVTAGASTPHAHIESVCAAIERIVHA